MAADPTTIENIRQVEQDIRETKSRLKVAKEARNDELTQLSEQRELEMALEAVAEARKKLKIAAQGDAAIKKLDDEIEAEMSQLADLQHILSHHLIEYREQSEASYIEEDDSKKVRPILVTAKLGKPEYHQEVIPL